MSMNSFHSRDQRAPPKPAQTRELVARPHGMLRADALLVEQKKADSRTRARQLIDAGQVSSTAGPVTKPSQLLAATTVLTVIDDAQSGYVSRGALKLLAALEHTGLSVVGRTCLDIGQSTGGFTDCLLQAGARKVVGVEVGRDQLHPRLRGNPDCVAFEGLNARQLRAEDLAPHSPAEGFDLIVCDASFISLTLLMPQWPALLAADGQILALVKPQFEVGAENLAKGGVVRDPSLYAQVEHKIRSFAQQAGLALRDWFDSPLLGGGFGNIEGNREFLIWMQHIHHGQD